MKLKKKLHTELYDWFTTYTNNQFTEFANSDNVTVINSEKVVIGFFENGDISVVCIDGNKYKRNVFEVEGKHNLLDITSYIERMFDA